MATTELSPVKHSRLRRNVRRIGISAGMAAIPLVLAAGLGAEAYSGFHPENTTLAAPAVTAPDTPSPSPRPSVTSIPKEGPKRGFPAAPIIHASSLAPTPTPSVDTFCDVQQNPVEGEFGENTGVHRIPASGDHQSIAIVTPDRSGVQQLKWKLPNQKEWITFDNGLTGIVFRTAVDVDVDTGGNRGMWFKECEKNVPAADSEIPSRVQDVFDKFGFGCVDVITVTKYGYVVQEVHKGQEYSEKILSTLVLFK